MLPAWPVRNGYALRVRNLLAELADGWALHLLAPGAPADDPERPPGLAAHHRLHLAGRGLTYTWRFDPAPLRDAIAGTLSEVRPDRALIWAGAEDAWLTMSGPQPPAVMDMIDCNPLEFWRGAFARGAGGLRERARSLTELGVSALHARRAVRGFAATSCVGEQDAAWLARLSGKPDRVHVVPNGVALPDLAALPDAAATPTLCFTGTLDYVPNTDAVRFLVEDVWPLVRAAAPAARLVIAGRSPLPWIVALHGRDGIEVAADVPEMAAVLRRAWAAIAPMRTGVGIKNKVLEAWACARPVVLTPLATNGLPPVPGQDRLVRADAPGLAEAAIALLSDAGLCHRLGESARAHAAASCSWRAAAKEMDRLLRAAT
ncbi:MAG: glycosyltransferase family 4 protein [Acetobacteraceae bacterium]|nr:glycosyltransferase family 4 protein [Acetobacteraceae bacterium]